ncbi:hypothetical protein RvY_02253-1 [Ramazzottius varieornatus]|uniref:Ammonium transporter AmtB-like domain-containing protein n=1 Tax=Ramazzottius varieornatus TaxID=947166 RepID=A0A1D1UJW4_RAMVA|nr:hypothetical protein RvY_02253-1 [Ramazzottius varieornatus]
MLNEVWKAVGYLPAGGWGHIGTAAWAFFVSFALLFVINKIPGLHLRQSEEDEVRGGDLAEMGEVGYILLGMEGTHSKDPKTGTERNYKNNAVHPIGVTNELNTYWDRNRCILKEIALAVA